MLSPAEPASSLHCETSVFVDEQEYIPVCVSVCTRGGGGGGGEGWELYTH